MVSKGASCSQVQDDKAFTSKANRVSIIKPVKTLLCSQTKLDITRYKIALVFVDSFELVFTYRMSFQAYENSSVAPSTTKEHTRVVSTFLEIYFPVYETSKLQMGFFAFM